MAEGVFTFKLEFECHKLNEPCYHSYFCVSNLYIADSLTQPATLMALQS